MSPEDAAAVVGLYLRQRNEFTIWKGQPAGTLESNRGLFYWVLTRRMLPAGWRWFGACVASSEDQEISELVLLAQSALVRLGRALRARDRVLVQFQLEQDNETAVEALFYLDVVRLPPAKVEQALEAFRWFLLSLRSSIN